MIKQKINLLNENSRAIVCEMSKLVGGGTDVSKIEEALEKGVEMVREKVGIVFLFQ